MYKIIGLFAIVLFAGCSNGGGGNDPQKNPEVPKQPEPDTRVTVSGKLEKGPFVVDTFVTVQGLDASGHVLVEETARTTELGRFEMKIPDAPYWRVIADGATINETTAGQTDPLTMRAISDSRTINVNVFSHLEAERLDTLMREGMSLENALSQAATDRERAFFLDNPSPVSATQLSISDSSESLGMDNGALFVLSAAFSALDYTQGDLTLLAGDFADDGLINGNGANALDELRFAATEMSLSVVSSFVEQELGDAVYLHTMGNRLPDWVGGPIKLADNAKIMEQAEAQARIQSLDMESGVIQMDGSADYEVGEVVSIPPTEAYPYGALVKINGVSEAGGASSYQVSPASIAQMYPNANIHVRLGKEELKQAIASYSQGRVTAQGADSDMVGYADFQKSSSALFDPTAVSFTTEAFCDPSATCLKIGFDKNGSLYVDFKDLEIKDPQSDAALKLSGKFFLGLEDTKFDVVSEQSLVDSMLVEMTIKSSMDLKYSVEKEIALSKKQVLFALKSVFRDKWIPVTPRPVIVYGITFWPVVSLETVLNTELKFKAGVEVAYTEEEIATVGYRYPMPAGADTGWFNRSKTVKKDFKASGEVGVESKAVLSTRFAGGLVIANAAGVAAGVKLDIEAFMKRTFVKAGTGQNVDLSSLLFSNNTLGMRVTGKAYPVAVLFTAQITNLVLGPFLDEPPEGTFEFDPFFEKMFYMTPPLVVLQQLDEGDPMPRMFWMEAVFGDDNAKNEYRLHSAASEKNLKEELYARTIKGVVSGAMIADTNAEAPLVCVSAYDAKYDYDTGCGNYFKLDENGADPTPRGLSDYSINTGFVKGYVGTSSVDRALRLDQFANPKVTFSDQTCGQAFCGIQVDLEERRYLRIGASDSWSPLLDYWVPDFYYDYKSCHYRSYSNSVWGDNERYHYGTLTRHGDWLHYVKTGAGSRGSCGRLGSTLFMTDLIADLWIKRSCDSVSDCLGNPRELPTTNGQPMISITVNSLSQENIEFSENKRLRILATDEAGDQWGLMAVCSDCIDLVNMKVGQTDDVPLLNFNVFEHPEGRMVSVGSCSEATYKAQGGRTSMLVEKTDLDMAVIRFNNTNLTESCSGDVTLNYGGVRAEGFVKPSL